MALDKMTQNGGIHASGSGGIQRSTSIPGPTVPVILGVTSVFVMVMVPMVVLALMLMRVAVDHHLAVLAIHLAL